MPVQDPLNPSRPAARSTTGPRDSVLMVLECAFPAWGGGGAETQVRTIARWLSERGVKVTVVVPRVSYAPQATRDQLDGFQIVRISYPHVRLLGAAVMLTRLVWLLVRRRRDYSVVHVVIANNMAAVTCVVARLLGKPTIVKLTGLHEMAGGILATNPGALTALKKRALQLATHYQATSSRIAQLLTAAGFAADKVRLIPNAVDTARFSPAPAHDGDRQHIRSGAGFIAVFTGRLVPEKGLELLLRAWPAVVSRRQDARLLLVGEGPLRDNLRSLAEELGIAERVSFVGHSDSVESYLRAADLGVLPSLSEGLSNTLLEFMATGLPVVGSRVSGTEDFVVPEETGWLFDAGSAEQLECCLLQATSAAASVLERMGSRARELVVSRASITAVAGRLVELYGVRVDS